MFNNGITGRHVTYILVAYCCMAGTWQQQDGACADVSPSSPDKIARVQAGELVEARASWWGFDQHDSTRFLQAALDSGVPRLVIDCMDLPWVVTPLQVTHDNMEIVLEPGVVVEAKPGAFKDTKDSLLSIIDRKHISLVGMGDGASLRMHRKDYSSGDYKKGEHRHCINIRSSMHIRIEGLSLTESGGDGIYIGTHYSRQPCEDIFISNVICDHNHRQGISVISVNRLHIENTILSNTSGTPPLSGIDFEPNHEYQVLKDIVLRNCIMKNNKGAGATLYSKLNADSDPISIRFERCLFENNPLSVTMVNAICDQDIVRGSFVVDTCVFDGGRGNALILNNKPVVGASLTVNNTIFCTQEQGVSPISIRTSADAALESGGVVFDACVVNVPLDTRIIQFDDQHGAQRISDISGTLAIWRDGKPSWLTLDEQYFAAISPDTHKRFKKYDIQGRAFAPITELPPVEKGSMPYGLGTFSVRHAGMIVVYASAGNMLELALTHGQAGWRKSDAAELYAFGPSGQKISLGRVPFKTRRTVTMEAPESGIYRIPFVVDNGGVIRDVKCNRPVLWAMPDKMYLHLFHYGDNTTQSSTGDLYFYVPRDTAEFAVMLAPRNNEWVGATIYDPEGKVVWSQDTITQMVQVLLEPTPDQTAKPWKVHIRPPAEGHMEDAFLLLQNVPPFLAVNPDALLVPEEDM